MFRNSNTNEEVNVSNLTLKYGRIFFSVRGKGCGQRFFNRNTCLVLDEEAEDGTFLKCADGWEVIKGRTPKPVQPVIATEETIVAEDAAEVLEPLTNTDNNTEAEVASIDGMKAEMLAKYGTKERALCAHK